MRRPLTSGVVLALTAAIAGSAFALDPSLGISMRAGAVRANELGYALGVRVRVAL